MADQHSKPPWWNHLVPARWQWQPPLLDQTGPAGSYAAAAARTRLEDPQWADAEPPAVPRVPEVGNARAASMSPLPTTGTGARRPNTRSYPT